LPTIQPHYAVKCNNDENLLKHLSINSVNFDCASRGEIKQILDLGIKSDRIIYANPYKNLSDIEYANNNNIPLTVVDSVEELNKLEKYKKLNILIRVKVNDKDSLMPFSSKFGSDFEETLQILKLAKKQNININGFSFHVGSGCYNSNQYYDAVKMIYDIINKSLKSNIKHDYKIIDIGGGFTGDNDNKFLDQATKINEALKLFKNTSYKNIKFISEPGRFYMTKTHTLYVPIIAKRKVGNKFFYIVDESLYSSFSNIAYDYAKPEFKLIKLIKQNEKSSSKYDSIIFGRTCDSQDKLVEMKLPELQIGNYFEIENMGAYTTVSSTNFNGFDTTEKVYL